MIGGSRMAFLRFFEKNEQRDTEEEVVSSVTTITGTKGQYE